MTDNKWNTGRTADGLSPLISEQEFIGGLLTKVPSYDPWKGSAREYVWTDDALCSYVDPVLFEVSLEGDPGAGGEKRQALTALNMEKYEQARAICASCPVRQRCLDESTPSDRFWTVRGGELPEKLSGPGMYHAPAYRFEG